MSSIPISSISAQEPYRDSGQNAKEVIQALLNAKDEPHEKWYDARHRDGKTWIRLKTAKPYQVSKVSLQSANDMPSRDPVHIQFYGIAVNGERVLLVEAHSIDFTARYQWKSFDLRPIDAEFDTFELKILKTRGTKDGVQLGQIKLNGLDAATRARLEHEKECEANAKRLRDLQIEIEKKDGEIEELKMQSSMFGRKVEEYKARCESLEIEKEGLKILLTEKEKVHEEKREEWEREKQELREILTKIQQEKGELVQKNEDIKLGVLSDALIPIRGERVRVVRPLCSDGSDGGGEESNVLMAECLVDGSWEAIARVMDEEERRERITTWIMHHHHPTHHNVVGVIDDLPAVEDSNGVFSLMQPHSLVLLEKIDGYQGTLRKYLEKSSPMDPKDVRSVLKDIVNGVANLHLEGVKHGCLESQAILLARSAPKDGNRGELHGIVTGIGMWSPHAIQDDRIRWIPEEILEKEGVDRTYESDVWSLGIIILEMMTGCIPYSSKRTPSAISRSIVRREFDKIPEEMRSLMPEVCGIMEVCLLGDPMMRPFASSIANQIAHWE
eukprot:TRINITY_DN6595_c1_g1_i1.p1 TRINITY_DN6595_c1_g1~~TRINITY_DN6595_c1_g1_i1.p1  ORF type:complete len:556 (-),score=155.08 TRINITY_DN6595_c1_g1_i1:909-2576(-)